VAVAQGRGAPIPPVIVLNLDPLVVDRFPPLREDMNVSVVLEGMSHTDTTADARFRTITGGIGAPRP